MIDIKFLRENPEIVKENIKKKFQDKKSPRVDEVIELDEKRRESMAKADELRANRNKLSKEIGALMAQGKKDEAMAMSEQLNVKLTDLPQTICKHCGDTSYVFVPSDVEELFKDVLDFILDCGAHYRISRD